MKPLSQAVPGALAALLQGSPLSQGKVAFAWNAVVGTAMQRATVVRIDGATLRVEAATPQWEREVSRSSRIILPRLQSLLGSKAVTRIEVRKRTPVKRNA